MCCDDVAVMIGSLYTKRVKRRRKVAELNSNIIFFASKSHGAAGHMIPPSTARL